MPRIQGKQIAPHTITQVNLMLSTPLSSDTTQAANVEYVNILSTSLTSSLSTETSYRLNLDGDGLSYNENQLKINVDEHTIKTVNDELKSTEYWMEYSNDTTISSGKKSTNISLKHEPIGYISAYINGVEYLISPTNDSQLGMPFYFKTTPTIGTKLWFDVSVAGFDLLASVDLITVKYNYI